MRKDLPRLLLQMLGLDFSTLDTCNGFGVEVWGEIFPPQAALFAQTGYGTGGLISAARSDAGRVPFLMAEITDDRTARAELRLSAVGGNGQILAPEQPLTITQKARTLDIESALPDCARAI